MATHELKIWPPYFEAVVSGKLRAQLRKNDRNYQTGDVLVLMEWNPVSQEYTGRIVRVEVTHVLLIGEIDANLKQAMGLNPCLAPVNALAVLSIDKDFRKLEE